MSGSGTGFTGSGRKGTRTAQRREGESEKTDLWWNPKLISNTCETFITMSDDSHHFDLKSNIFLCAVFKTEGTPGHTDEKREALIA